MNKNNKTQINFKSLEDLYSLNRFKTDFKPTFEQVWTKSVWNRFKPVWTKSVWNRFEHFCLPSNGVHMAAKAIGISSKSI